MKYLNAQNIFLVQSKSSSYIDFFLFPWVKHKLRGLCFVSYRKEAIMDAFLAKIRATMIHSQRI